MRRPKNKYITISILVLLALILSGFSVVVADLGSKPETVQASSKMVIGCSFDNSTDTFNSVVEGVSSFAKDHPDVQFIIYDSNKDSIRQLDTIDYFIMKKVDAIMLKTLDLNMTSKISEKCAEAGIPLIAIGIPIQAPATAFVGSDDYQSGVMQMEYLAEQAGFKGSVAILQDNGLNPASQMRTKGNLDVIAKYPGLKIVDIENGMWQRDKSFMITSNWLINHPDIGMIVANNDEMAIGAAKACEEAGNRNILIAGIDATPDAVSKVENGSLAATIFQDNYRQGYTAAQTAMQAALGESVPAVIDIPNLLVNPETLAAFNKK